MHNLIRTLSQPHVLAALIGGLTGAAVVFLLRAAQVWRHRQSLEFSNYEADEMRRRFTKLGAVFLAAAAIGELTHLGLLLHEARPTPAPEMPEDQGDPAINGMRLFVPTAGVNAPVISAPIVAGQWDVSRVAHEVAHLSGTAYPGELGNCVLAGHVTIPGAGWGPFRELENLRMGDEVFLSHSEQSYTYQVVEKRTVHRSSAEVAYPTADRRVTILTCAGWNEEIETYLERIVVVARMVERT